MLMLFSGHVVGRKSVPRSPCLQSTSPNTAEICNHIQIETCCVTTPSPHWDAMLVSQNINEACIIPQLIWTQSYMEEKRGEDKREEVMWAEERIEGVKGKEEMRWKLVVFGVLLKHCATSSPTATSSLQLFQFPTIICHLQFPFTFTPSFTPLFSVSHTACHKRQRGGSEGWIKRLISLSPPMHREIERNCDREGSKRGFLSSSPKIHRSYMSDLGMTWWKLTD